MQPRTTSRRRPTAGPISLVCVTATVLAAIACGAPQDSSASATWVVAPGQRVTTATSELEVLVSRLGCNNGVTGEVQAPDLAFSAKEAVLTFSVTPDEPSEAGCPDNDPVLYRVELPEPLGDRRLVDGQCRSGSEGADTTLCASGGVRSSP